MSLAIHQALEAKQGECDRLHAELSVVRAERDAALRAVGSVLKMASFMRKESVTASPAVRSIALKIAGEIESRCEVGT